MTIGRIYKIVSGQTNECYVGSTFNELKYRFRQHKNDYKQWKDGLRWGCASFDVFDKYGIDNCRMLLIKEYKVEDRKHLQMYEQLWINKLKSINKLSAFVIEPVLKKMIAERDKKNYKENKERILEQKKKYYEENKEQLLEKNKKYRKENKEKITEQYKKYRKEHKKERKEYNKKYCEEHKEELSKKKKKYREENKEKLSQKRKKRYEENKEQILEKRKEKITCEICGYEIRKDGKSEHERSKKHQTNLSKQQP